MSGEALTADVEKWRRHELSEAGYPAADASLLAADPEVDLHEAVGLLEQGCSVEVALLILL